MKLYFQLIYVTCWDLCVRIETIQISSNSFYFSFFFSQN